MYCTRLAVHLHCACVRIHLVLMIVSHTYYTCLSSQDGDSSLILAARRGHTEVVMELMKEKAILNLQNEVC